MGHARVMCGLCEGHARVMCGSCRGSCVGHVAGHAWVTLLLLPSKNLPAASDVTPSYNIKIDTYLHPSIIVDIKNNQDIPRVTKWISGQKKDCCVGLS